MMERNQVRRPSEPKGILEAVRPFTLTHQSQTLSLYSSFIFTNTGPKSSDSPRIHPGPHSRSPRIHSPDPPAIEGDYPGCTVRDQMALQGHPSAGAGEISRRYSREDELANRRVLSATLHQPNHCFTSQCVEGLVCSV